MDKMNERKATNEFNDHWYIKKQNKKNRNTKFLKWIFDNSKPWNRINEKIYTRLWNQNRQKNSVFNDNKK